MCYGPSDLRMGTCIAVYGRLFFIHDCDDFTRKWLKVSHHMFLFFMQGAPCIEKIGCQMH